MIAANQVTYLLAAPLDRRPVVVSGPSGVGKGTLINRLQKKYLQVFVATVSHTTRQRRAGEVEGIAYHFVSQSEFDSRLAQNACIESAWFSGHQYGTSKRTVTEQTAEGFVVILDIDVQGAKTLKADPSMEARYVFIEPPSIATLEVRLRERSTKTEENIEYILKRLSRAVVELEEADRSSLYEVCIVNDDLDTAFQVLEKFIFR